MDDKNEKIIELANGGNVTKADDLLRKLMQTNKEEWYPSLKAFTAVLNAWTTIQDNEDENVLYQKAEKAHEVLIALQRHAFLHPTPAHCQQVLGAWSRVPTRKGVPQRSQRILEQMNDKPLSIHTYNTVMSTWAKSHEHMRGTMAQNLFDRLKKDGIAPNGETHRILMYAWIHSRQYRAAFHATGHLMTMMKKLRDNHAKKKYDDNHDDDDDDDSWEPTLEDYRMVLDAWTRAEDHNGPHKALTVLRWMDHAYIARTTDVRPDRDCYKSLLRCMAQSCNYHYYDLGQHADQIMDKMMERLVLPDTDCYTLTIRAWLQGAQHQQKASDECLWESHAQRALYWLREMEQAYDKSRHVLVLCQTENYNDVLRLLSMVRDRPEAAEIAESLCYDNNNNNHNMQPNAETHTLLLRTLASNCNKDTMMEKGLRVFDSLFQQDDGIDINDDMVVEVLNAFVWLCAAARPGSFRHAVEAVERIVSHFGAKPNADTFRALLEASADHDKAMEGIFRNCCAQGLVDRGVLEALRNHASERLYHDLVLVAAQTKEDKRVVPSSWTRNLTGNKVLSVDFGFIRTVEMAQAKMQKRRNKQELNLLKGGRLQQQQ